MHQRATLTVLALLSLGPITACGSSGSSAIPTAASRTSATSPSSLTINGITTLSARGESQPLLAMVAYADGTTLDRTTVTRWSSSNEAVATVAASGTVTAVADGRTTITAAFETVSASKTIVVDLP